MKCGREYFNEKRQDDLQWMRQRIEILFKDCASKDMYKLDVLVLLTHEILFYSIKELHLGSFDDAEQFLKSLIAVEGDILKKELEKE